MHTHDDVPERESVQHRLRASLSLRFAATPAVTRELEVTAIRFGARVEHITTKWRGLRVAVLLQVRGPASAVDAVERWLEDCAMHESSPLDMQRSVT